MGKQMRLVDIGIARQLPDGRSDRAVEESREEHSGRRQCCHLAADHGREHEEAERRTRRHRPG